MSNGRMFAASCLCALLVAVGLAVPAQAATGAIHSLVERADGGDTAIDGCVDVYSLRRELVQSVCGTLTGETVVAGLEPGKYKVRYVDFTGLENLWHGGSAAFEDAGTVTVASGGTTELEAELETSATIQGVFGESVETLHEGPMFIYDMQGRFIDTTYPFDEAGVLRFHFEHVPAGTYKMRYVPSDETAGHWYAEPGDISAKPITVVSGQTTSPITLEVIEDYVSAFSGTLNTPVVWDAPIVCAVAVDDTNTALSVDCGARGGHFAVDVPGNQVASLAFVAEDLSTAEEYAESTAPVVYWPNTSDFADAEQWTFDDVPTTVAPPIWFFTDVYSHTSHMEPIKWMGDAAISKGYADGSFRPTSSVKRSDAALFFYRLAGEPQVTPPRKSPFSDVKSTSAAYGAIYWMRHAGISTANPFEPNKVLTRRQAVMFLYRLAGEPSVALPSTSPFSDVKTSDVGYRAIIWAEQEGIANGFEGGVFRPANTVLRQHLAAFMFRFAQQ